MNHILEVKNLTKAYRDFKLDNISFQITKGTIMGLIGENGAGKSTIINGILDLIKKDSGKITFLGKTLSSNEKELKEEIGVVFDTVSFHEMLTPNKIEKISAMGY